MNTVASYIELSVPAEQVLPLTMAIRPCDCLAPPPPFLKVVYTPEVLVVLPPHHDVLVLPPLPPLHTYSFCPQ